MKKIAKFYKVSREQFISDWKDALGKDVLEKDALEKAAWGETLDKEGYREEVLAETYYEQIKLPRRATAKSAGYDFFLPFSLALAPGEEIKIPTGIRVEMEPEWVLLLYPRSGLGFKYRLQMNNTVGIIDSDYFYSDNEGHILMKLINDSREGRRLELKAGMAFAQGIFMEYGITVDDDADEVRNGGFGSTDIRK